MAFLELWPVKGFQYLLPLAPVVAVLAAEGLRVLARAFAHPGSAPAGSAVLVAILSRTSPSPPTPPSHRRRGLLLAGSGGVPGGRETGRWITANVPVGATMLAIGPSMANILEYYGHRQAYGLSVSTNPLHRNPIYQAVANPDLSLRRGDIQYIVWDAFSARRTRVFERRLLRYVARYRGRVVYTYSALPAPRRPRVRVPVIVDLRGAP